MKDAYATFDIAIERWRPVVGWPYYDVSDHGQVRSWWPSNRQGRSDQPKLRKLVRFVSEGHFAGMQVVLSHDKQKTTCYVHRIVLEAFIGPCPSDMECRHLDGDPSNNKLINLRWGTHIENSFDQIKHGTDTRGERNAEAKFDYETVVEIRQRLQAGETQQRIANEYGVSGTTVHAIKWHKTYKSEAHIKMGRR